MSDKPEPPKDPIPSELAQEDASFSDLVQEFVEGLHQRVDDIVEAARQRDYTLLRTLAHQLKGTAGGYGYPVLTRKAAEMEIHVVAGELEAIQDDICTLQEMVSRVVVRE